MSNDERTYCVVCVTNYDDDGFDYRFDFPICHKCVTHIKEMEQSHE